ncbi:EscU/YscU/HrcU family type III secretion system export apparatus switch protein [Priestia koreensis]|uniref:Flagellar biosynthesis protein n=1 Tax=Priestia koreensis TaxID=284581 RepID=A0A0M0KED5_9BACI|nr:EscU/YscU/HrcU family type III secretion system export apparatus switch protein [Priestia koreensis]KOO37206.1 hypothetical protein AMD01_22255 [Priestia koreensis]MCM3004583.1 EscU/YscU/HrcU family type III secretion system export apparatus switch protein [Priestia koreensis]UNL84794.1 EscU/YscU/HrcU family type III secretion system export apparatus switch protein [Priestia koreensis]
MNYSKNGQSQNKSVDDSLAAEAASKQVLRFAEEHKVAIQRDPLLMKELLQVDLGERVPPQLYAVIAELFAFIHQVENSDEKTE